MPRPRAVSAGLAVAAMAVTFWVRMLPLSLAGIEPAARAQLTFRAADGREYPYLGGHDSYDWLREARTYLRTGTVCDEIVDGECRDSYALAPVGTRMEYTRSLHVMAIVLVHRTLTFFRPALPLSVSAFLVPVLVGTLGTLPAFAIGRRLAGDVGGFAAALLLGVNPLFLLRSVTSDNDVWNVVLPLLMVWAALALASAIQVRKQLAWAVAIDVIAAAHALIWDGWLFGYAVMLSGLVLHAVVSAVRSAFRSGWKIWQVAAVRSAAIAPALVVGIAVIGAIASGLRPANLAGRIALPAHVFARSPGGESVPGLPDAFTTVDELARQDLGQLANMMSGVAYFFVAWLGLLVICMPSRGWRPWHFALLIGGNYLYWYLLTRGSLGRPVLLGLLTLPLVAALAVSAAAKNDADEPVQAAGILVVVWFLAALFLAFEGLRFAMLLVPPFAIALGVALGRFSEWLRRQAVRLRGAEKSALRALAVVFPLAVLVSPVWQGYATARSYVPRIHDAWWDALARIRDESPADAIVTTWWPYGYWVKYVAERRVSADGGSLPTHVPPWLGRALLAESEPEAAGLFRMLACGSDATPQPAKVRGACKRIAQCGLDGMAAHAMMIEMASLGREQADALLQERHIPPTARTEILAATRCQAPPTYLVLSDEMVRTRGWKYLGNWGLPERDSVAREEYSGGRWIECRAGKSPQERVCPLNLSVGQTGAVVDSFVYSRESPAGGQLRWHGMGEGSTRRGMPAAIVIAEGGHIESIPFRDAVDPGTAVLVDVANDRVLVGSPVLLRSVFTRLMFLDATYAPHFEKFDDRTGYGGERVVTWKINWSSTE